MEPHSLDIKARISLLSTEDGGRHRPFFDGYRPNHNFGGPENTSMQIGIVHMGTGDAAYPGETKEVKITFLNTPGLRELLVPGRTWRIQEGRRLIATAEVLP